MSAGQREYVCSIACLLSSDQRKTAVENSKVLEDTNLNFCHPFFEHYYVPLSFPTDSKDSNVIYILVGSLSALVNIVISVVGARLVWLDLNRHDFETNENENLTKFKKIMRSGNIMLPFLVQIVDSILDSVYFIQLKSNRRLIHVPREVHIFQGSTWQDVMHWLCLRFASAFRWVKW